MEQTIPLYTADGELSGFISEQQVQHLEGMDLAVVVRHRKGRVARCILRQRADGPRPVQLSDYLGTRYCVREHLPSGARCWKLRGSRAMSEGISLSASGPRSEPVLPTTSVPVRQHGCAGATLAQGRSRRERTNDYAPPLAV